MYTMIIKKDPEYWLSDNFRSDEFLCKCDYSDCNFSFMYNKTINSCQLLRKHVKHSLTITSASRCQVHNANSGGLSDSYHLKGHAVDIFVHPKYNITHFADLARMFFDVVVEYAEEGFVHCHNI